MSAEVMAQLDALIAQKRQELKNLLFARDALLHIANGGQAEVPIEVMTVLQLTEGEGSKKEAARKKAPLIDKKTRRDAIKQRAVQIPQHQGEGGRRNFTDAQKLRILNEYDKAPRKRDIIEKYRLSPSCITNWKQKREDGELRPSAGEAEEPSLDLSEEIEDGDVMIQREFADDDVSYDEPLDLVAELAALEESPPDPFEGMRGRAPM